MLTATGGQIGHRKYDCPEQRNFTANIICRVCGNAGHMARDCPDRQRGSDPRNNVGRPQGQGRIGSGDAVDREMEQLFQELGGAPSAGPQARIEAGSGSYDQGDSYGGGRDAKPWEKGPTGAPAPWQRPRDEGRGGGGGGSGGAAPPWAQRNEPQGGYGGASGGAPGAAPWQQAAPPPPPPGGAGYGYGYPGSNGYGEQGGYTAPPPGLPQNYTPYGAPPPPPGSAPPPPPPGDAPPP